MKGLLTRRRQNSRNGAEPRTTYEISMSYHLLDGNVDSISINNMWQDSTQFSMQLQCFGCNLDVITPVLCKETQYNCFNQKVHLITRCPGCNMRGVLKINRWLGPPQIRPRTNTAIALVELSGFHPMAGPGMIKFEQCFYATIKQRQSTMFTISWNNEIPLMFPRKGILNRAASIPNGGVQMTYKEV